MKFGKSLSNQIEEALPEWRDKFLSYKNLKKRLKLISACASPERPTKRPRVYHPNGTCGFVDATTAVSGHEGERDHRYSFAIAASMSKEEEDFLKLLENELEKFNSFFVEKEEEYIIRQKELQDQVARAAGHESKEEMMRVRKEIVDFHGEMVLLENYSALNYTGKATFAMQWPMILKETVGSCSQCFPSKGLVKILKKYDKRTGALIRLPFIQKVLQQPFFTTDLLYKLVKECELMLDRLLPKKNCPSISMEGGGDVNEGKGQQKSKPSSSSSNSLVVPEMDEIEYMESLYMKSTIAALRVLKEIRSGSSTVSIFSLPPLQSNGVDEKWNGITVLEQAAK